MIMRYINLQRLRFYLTQLRILWVVFFSTMASSQLYNISLDDRPQIIHYSVWNFVGDMVLGLGGRYLHTAKYHNDGVGSYHVGTDGKLTNYTSYDDNNAAEILSVAISPNGRQLYVCSEESSTITVYQVGNQGSLTNPVIYRNGMSVSPSDSRVHQLEGVRHIVTDNTGRYLYAFAKKSGTVSVYAVVGSGLDLLHTYANGTDENEVDHILDGVYHGVMHPLKPYLYVLAINSNAVTLYEVLNSGALVQIQVYRDEEPLNEGGDEQSLKWPLDAAISKDGLHLYLTDGQKNSLSIYTLESDGRFSSVLIKNYGIEYTRFGFIMRGPTKVILSENNRNLFVTSYDYNKLIVYDVTSDGYLTNEVIYTQGVRLDDFNQHELGGPYSLVISKNGIYLYVATLRGTYTQIQGEYHSPSLSVYQTTPYESYDHTREFRLCNDRSVNIENQKAYVSNLIAQTCLWIDNYPGLLNRTEQLLSEKLTDLNRARLNYNFAAQQGESFARQLSQQINEVLSSISTLDDQLKLIELQIAKEQEEYERPQIQPQESQAIICNAHILIRVLPYIITGHLMQVLLSNSFR